MRTFHGEVDVPTTSDTIIDSGPSARGWSYYTTFLRCPMLFYWRHVYARRDALGWNDTTRPLARGTIFHVGLAHHYARMWATANGKDPAKILAPQDAIDEMARRIGPVGQEMLPVASGMLDAYWRTYPTESFAVVSVEEPMSLTFGAALYTARVDLAVEEGGKVFIYDTKTTAAIQATKTIRKYTLHGQFFGQHYLGRKYFGDRFGGVVVNVIDEQGRCLRRRPDPAPFTLRHFPGIIERAHVAITARRAECGDDMERWALHACPDEQICVSPYGYCPAFELCRYGAP